MTLTIIAALIFGWIVVSALVCVTVCMASSQFGSQAEARSRRGRPPSAVSMESGASPVKVEAG